MQRFIHRFMHVMRSIPKTVIYIGIYSMIMNFSSAVVYAHLGIFLTSTFNSTRGQIGCFESVVAFLSYVIRLLSGILSDYLRNRKALIIFGCLLVVISNVSISLAGTLAIALFIRSFGRVGHGIQSLARSVLIGDVSSKGTRGICYGVSRSFGVFGSLVGTLLLYIVSSRFVRNYDVKKLLLLMAIPPLIATIIVILKVKEPSKNSCVDNDSYSIEKKSSFSIKDISKLSSKFWIFMIVIAMMSVTHTNEMLIMTDAINRMNRPMNELSLISAIFNFSSVLAASSLGFLSERIGRYYVLLIVFVLKSMVQFSLAMSVNSYGLFLISMFLFGIPLVAVQNIPEVIIADLAPKEYRGTAFGIYYTILAVFASLSFSCFGYMLDKKSFIDTMLIFSFCSMIVAIILLALCLTVFKKGAKHINEKRQ